MYPAEIATLDPDRPAIIMGNSGESITYLELSSSINRLAQLFRSKGLGIGSHVAVFLPNDRRFLEIAWACHTAGLRLTPIYASLTAEEAAYIIDDSGAELVVGSAQLPATSQLQAASSGQVTTWLAVDGDLPGWEFYDAQVAQAPDSPIDDMRQGGFMFYSSGTTGRPKGIEAKLTYAPLNEFNELSVTSIMDRILRDAPRSVPEVWLVPGPLYFSAASNLTMAMMHAGSTVILMERFSAENVLELIDRYAVTIAQFVPTHFTRLLALPAEMRDSTNLSTLKAVFHAGAPCPIDVKRRMIEWWGPIISEYYASSEGVGFTWITAKEWLARPGSVGRQVFGSLIVVDEDGKPLPPGVDGQIWAAGAPAFEYRNVTTEADHRGPAGYRTVGDIGHVDEDGYLYLTDRKAFTIISGGVNIYPQEIENLILEHPMVADVAVFGVPNEEFGEEVKAVVEPREWADAGPALAADLEAFCRQGLAGYKIPRSFDFERSLPRQETGKLKKGELRARYMSAQHSKGKVR